MTVLKGMLAGLATAGLTMFGAAGSAFGDTTLTLWSIDEDNEQAAILAREFSEADNGITIEYRLMQFNELVSEALRAFATGQTPDMIAVDNPEHPLFSSRGAFLDITDFVATSEVIGPDSYFPGPLASVMWEDRIYGLPKATNTIGLYYNKDMFKAAGLDPENPPQTWDELIEAARALNSPEDSVYGLAFSAVGTEEGTFQFLPWAQMAGGGYDDLNSEGVVEALEIWKAILDEGLASPDTLSRGQWISTGTFNSGNAAMAISGPWELNRMLEEAAFDWGVTLLPIPQEGAERSSAMGDFNWAIFSTTEHPEEAFKAIEYFASQDHRLVPEFGLLPARSDVEVAETGELKRDEALAVFIDQLQYAQPRGPHPEWPQISKAIQTAIQSALTGQMSAQEALDQAQSTVDGILN